MYEYFFPQLLIITMHIFTDDLIPPSLGFVIRGERFVLLFVAIINGE